MSDDNAQLKLVVVGHVDHGKSTIIGRLLADTGSLPDGKLELVKEKCEKTGKQFEYAFLLDALADEQSQGITIDAARIFFRSTKRQYLIFDAPGHIEFLKNMISGAAQAEAALLVIDANEGVQENSKRHGFMLSMLGIRNVIVLVNKMDLVAYAEEAFSAVVEDYRKFLQAVEIRPQAFIPVSGLFGEGLISCSAHLPWYKGDTVLEALDKIEQKNGDNNHPFRMFVQDIYKFTKFGDHRRIVSGTIDSGTIRVGEEVLFYPSLKKSTISSIECFAAPTKTTAEAGEAVGFMLGEQIYVARGELAVLAGQSRPEISTKLRVSLFWLGREPLAPGKSYLFKIGTAKLTAGVESIAKVIDASDLTAQADAHAVERNQVAECVLRLNKSVPCDPYGQCEQTRRFIIVDGYRIAGGGIIREALRDELAENRERKERRNSRWIHSLIADEDRAERYGQKPTLVLISGMRKVDRKKLGKALEAQLFGDGRIVYYLGIGNIIHGLDADIERQENIGREHIRRLAELANIMLNAGLLLVVSAAELSQQDLELINELIGAERVKTVWLGPETRAESGYDLYLPEIDNLAGGVREIKEMLYINQIIFRPC